MEHETAGDPISGLKWTRKTTEGLAEELKKLSIEVSANTVAKLLKSLDFSLRGNHKKHPANTKVAPKERDQQFIHIRHLREQFSHWQCPIISIDTKKKKMIGNFKNNGLAWSKEPTGVNDHDFKSQSDGTGIPYGIYEILTNEGSVFIGTSYDTPAFAVACLEQWWQRLDKSKYKRNDKLLILADSGGSNGTKFQRYQKITPELTEQEGLLRNFHLEGLLYGLCVSHCVYHDARTLLRFLLDLDE